MPSIEKKIMLREMMKKVENKPYLFFAQFGKMSAGDVSGLRRDLSKSADGCMVIKNKLAKIAFKELGFSNIDNFVEGQTFIATCVEEPQRISKVFVDFAKEKEGAFKIKGAFLEGKVFDTAYVKELAKLPGKQELLTRVAVGVKSPITGFVLTLNALVRSFVVVMNQIALKKGETSAS